MPPKIHTATPSRRRDWPIRLPVPTPEGPSPAGLAIASSRLCGGYRTAAPSIYHRRMRAGRVLQAARDDGYA